MGFQRGEREAAEGLRDPGVADFVVDVAEAVVVAEQRLGVVGGVFEGDELQGGVEVVAGEHTAVLEEREEGFREVVTVTCLVHVEAGVVPLVGVGSYHDVQGFGGACWPMCEVRGLARDRVGIARYQQQAQQRRRRG